MLKSLEASMSCAMVYSISTIFEYIFSLNHNNKVSNKVNMKDDDMKLTYESVSDCVLLFL